MVEALSQVGCGVSPFSTGGGVTVWGYFDIDTQDCLVHSGVLI